MEVVDLFDEDGFKYATLLMGKVVWLSSPQKYQLEISKIAFEVRAALGFVKPAVRPN